MYAQNTPTPDPLVVSTEAVQGVCPPFLHLSMSTGWPDEHRQVFILDDPAHRSAGRRAHVHVDNILLPRWLTDSPVVGTHSPSSSTRVRSALQPAPLPALVEAL
jgi:hypothetical protein